MSKSNTKKSDENRKHGHKSADDLARERVIKRIANVSAELSSEDLQAVLTRQAIANARRRMAVAIATADESAEAGFQKRLAQARALAGASAKDLETLRSAKEVLRPTTPKGKGNSTEVPAIPVPVEGPVQVKASN